ncbi:hypothetical protein AB1L88_15705 [Tautonia sp. JC769]|uniref:hypothetical protein n=1 Tax=Tautonia sp. JC769 TaxID=3232135 RepID=UPI003457EE56
MNQLRRVHHFDRSEAGDLLIAPARAGHFLAVFGLVVQGHEDGNVVQLRGSANGSDFTARHWPIKADAGSGAGESLGGDTPIAVLPGGEGLYLTTSSGDRVGGNVVYDYLPGEPIFG